MGFSLGTGALSRASRPRSHPHDAHQARMFVVTSEKPEDAARYGAWMSEHERSLWTGRRRRVMVTIAGATRVGATLDNDSARRKLPPQRQRASSWIRRQGVRFGRWGLVLGVG